MFNACFDRYLRELGHTYTILNLREFASSKDVLEGKARVIREDGKGGKPNKSSSLTAEEALPTYGQ